MRVPFSLLALLALLLSSGCLSRVGPDVDVEETTGGLRLIVDEGDQPGWHIFSVENQTSEMRRVGCSESFCMTRTLRVQSEQPDGSWVGRQVPVGDLFEDAFDVHPGQTVTVAHLSPFEPGTYRVLIRVEGEEEQTDVVRELSVVGWSEQAFEDGLALRAQADETGCGSLEREVDVSLRDNVEPDVLLDLLAADREHEAHRAATIRRMVERGMFVSELSDEVRGMSIEDATWFAGLLSPSVRDDEQSPLRPVVAARLMDAFDDYETPLEQWLLMKLSQLDDDWPAHAPDTIIARIEDGPEADEALAELINLLVYVHSYAFTGYEDVILEVLGLRCDGGSSDLVREACERAIDKYSSEGLGLYGRGWGGSGCGGALYLESPHAACEPIEARWTELSATAGEPLFHVLGAYSLDVPIAE